MMSTLHTVVSSFADAGGVVVVQSGRAELNNGRASVAPVTITTATDIAHHPINGGAVTERPGADAFLSSTERRAFYLHSAAYPAVAGAASAQPWWFVVAGKAFVAESVEPWTGGGFWVVVAREIHDQPLLPLWFGDMPAPSTAALENAYFAALVDVGVNVGAAAAVVPALAVGSPPSGGVTFAITPAGVRALMIDADTIATLDPETTGGFDAAKGIAVASVVDDLWATFPVVDVDAPMAYAPTRDFRITTSAAAVPFVVWRADAPALSGTAPTFRGIDAAGNAVVLSPIAVLTATVGGVDLVAAILPAALSPEALTKIEVIG